MKIELRIQQYHRQTHRHTEWLLELLVGAKKDLGLRNEHMELMDFLDNINRRIEDLGGK